MDMIRPTNTTCAHIYMERNRRLLVELEKTYIWNYLRFITVHFCVLEDIKL